MHPDLITYTERDQQTSEPFLSWAAFQLLSESSCKAMSGTETGVKNTPTNQLRAHIHSNDL